MLYRVKSTNMTPLLTQKTVHMILRVEMVRLNFWRVLETVYLHAFKKLITDSISQLLGRSIVFDVLRKIFTHASFLEYELFLL